MTPWQIHMEKALQRRTDFIGRDIQNVIKPDDDIRDFEIRESTSGDYFGIWSISSGRWLIGDGQTPRFRWRA
jgi:hypothetical protein